MNKKQITKEQRKMKNEQREMRSEQGARNIVLPLFFILCSFFFSNCNNMFNSPANVQPQAGSGYGKVSIGFVGGAQRTIFPDIPIFDAYIYTFTGLSDEAEGESYPDMEPDADGFFILKLGTWKVEVEAFIGGVIAASGEGQFTLAAGNPIQKVDIELDAAGEDGEGTFSYYIEYPLGAAITEFTLLRLPALADGIDLLDLDPDNTDANISESGITLDAGFYLLNIQFEKEIDGKLMYAGKKEVIHIYDKLHTVYGTHIAPVVFDEDVFSVLAVSFYAGAGGPIAVQYVQFGGKANAIDSADNNGWYAEHTGETWDFANDVVTRDINLRARMIPYVITGTSPNFTATKYGIQVGATGAIQSVIDAVRTDTEGINCSIQFGTGGTNQLNIATAAISFNGVNEWGTITLLGRITGANTVAAEGTIVLADDVSIDSRADIANTGTGASGRAIINNGTGTVSISGGTVSATTGQAIHNALTGKITVSGDNTVVTSANITSFAGTIVIANNDDHQTDPRLEITGGTVRSTVNNTSARAIYNASTGGVSISGGTVSASTGQAIHNALTGKITVSGDNTVVTSSSAAANAGTIFIANIGTDTANRLEITGGTVRSTLSNVDSRAIYNASTGGVSISGGTVSATTGQAIQNANTGLITVSGTAIVTSANITAAAGTIVISGTQTAAGPRLEINGGMVRNTSTETNGNAVYNWSTNGAVHISGGNTSTTATNGFVVQHTNVSARLVLGGDPQISGESGIRVPGGSLIVSTSANPVPDVPEFMPGTSRMYVLNYPSYTANMIAVGNGKDFRDFFALHDPNVSLEESGDNLIVKMKDYAYTKDGTIYTITLTDEPGFSSIQTLIEAIRDDADGEACTIQFGNGDDELKIYLSSVSFNGAWGYVTLAGKISSEITATGTIIVAGSVSINSQAEILNSAANGTGMAINHTGTGTVTISGGTVSGAALGNRAIRNASSGHIIINGGTVSTVSSTAIENASTGTITVSGTGLVTSPNISATAGTIVIANNGTATANRLVITGGTVSNTASDANARAIYNASTGGVSISGGTVSAVFGQAIHNALTGLITVSETAMITSTNVDTSGGTIVIASSGTATANRLVITGGTVRNTLDNTNAKAISNNSTGGVNISGGTVSAVGGSAITSSTIAVITISEGTITSSISGNQGTIWISGAQEAGTRLQISGGTVSNTSTGSAVRNTSTNGAVHISGGSISTNAVSGFAVDHGQANTQLVLGGNPEISGGTGIRVHEGRLSVSTAANPVAGVPVFAPGTGRRYVLNYASYAVGMLVVQNGAGFFSNFTLRDLPMLMEMTASGGNLVIAAFPALGYDRNGSTYTITYRSSSPYADLQAIINAIRNDAAGENCTIQFRDGSSVIDNGTNQLLFNGTWGTITLLGRITSSNANSAEGTIVIADNISIDSWADIANTAANGRAVNNTSAGVININGGRLSSSSGQTIHNASTGKIMISGESTMVLASGSGGASTSTAIFIANSGTDTANRLEISGGTVSASGVTTTAIRNASTGGVSISGGAIFTSGVAGEAINNFNTGTVTISGGTVSGLNLTEVIRNSSTGTVSINGGTVSTTNGQAIHNASTGTVTVSGGTISATANEGRAIHNANIGTITISGEDTVITSVNVIGSGGTIVIANSGTATENRLIITGGTVSNTMGGNGINNASTGSVHISGGTVSAVTGQTVLNTNTGKITVSGGTVTSANINETAGTIVISGVHLPTNARLEISGDAVVSNTSTAANSNVVYNSSSNGAVHINGGTVLTTATDGFAVQHINSNSFVLNNSPVITGRIRVALEILSLGDSFAPNGVYTLDFTDLMNNIIAVIGGADFAESFELPIALQEDWRLEAEGSNLLLRSNP